MVHPVLQPFEFLVQEGYDLVPPLLGALVERRKDFGEELLRPPVKLSDSFAVFLEHLSSGPPEPGYVPLSPE
jgi:hypothetical protein